jgi:hypothetical protein
LAKAQMVLQAVREPVLARGVLLLHPLVVAVPGALMERRVPLLQPRVDAQQALLPVMVVTMVVAQEEILLFQLLHTLWPVRVQFVLFGPDALVHSHPQEQQMSNTHEPLY